MTRMAFSSAEATEATDAAGASSVVVDEGAGCGGDSRLSRLARELLAARSS